MAIRFNEAQTKAIETHNCNLLISAAAGSGKTAVLVQRIIEMITSDQKPVSVDKLLVVTFTEASAKEMKQRLKIALSALISENPKNSALRKQLLLVNSASISTIHSFCLSIIKRYFYLIDLDPNFKTLDEAQAEIILAKCCKELFEESHKYEYRYETLSALVSKNSEKLKKYMHDFNVLSEDELFEKLFSNEFEDLKQLSDHSGAELEAMKEELEKDGYIKGFWRMIEAFSTAIKDDRMQDLLIQLFKKIQSLSYPEQWLNSVVDSYSATNIREVTESAWYKLMLQKAKEDIGECIFSINTVINSEIFNEIYPANKKSCISFREDLTKLLNLCEEDVSQASLSAAELSPPPIRLNRKEAEFDSRIKEANDLYDNCKNTIDSNLKTIKTEIFSKTQDELLKELSNCKPYIDTIAALIRGLAQRYNDAKREINVVDFSDYEHFCLRILTCPDGAAVLAELRDKYAEVLVDEYQDTNYIQEAILSAVSTESLGRPNMFMVGDLKQSIYRFRYANPDIFNGKYKSYGSEGLHRKIILSENFRSRENVISSINYIFSQIMSPELGEVEYDADAALNYGAKYYDNTSTDTVTEILIADNALHQEQYISDDNSSDDNDNDSDTAEELIREMEKSELEAKITALKIYELLGMKDGKPMMVYDGNSSLRPIKPSDIAILMRSLRASSEVFKRELKNLNIPCASSDSGDSFYQEIEVMTIISFLQIIDNPYQDIHLITILYSDLYSLTADELTSIRKSLPKGLFFDALVDYNGDKKLSVKIERFLNDLKALRFEAEYLPTSELIWHIYETTGLYELAGLMKGGKLRQRNLMSFFENAIEYEKTGMTGLFNFMRYFETARKHAQYSKHATQDSDADCVKIMTIHKSKGLEFPVVFVCRLGGQFNEADTRAKIMFHPLLGMGIDFVDLSNRISSKTIYKEAIKEKIRRENLSEEIRNLYVAMTRAKEKLILVGSSKDLCDGRIDKLHIPTLQKTGGRRLSPAMLIRKRNYLSWILPCVMYHRDWHFTAPAYSAPEELRNDSSSWRIQIRTVSQVQSEINEIFETVIRADSDDSPQIFDKHLYDDIKRRLDYEYEFKLNSLIPAKLTISEIKRIQHNPEFSLFDLKKKDKVYEIPDFINQNIQTDPARRGTLLHMFMEQLDFSRIYDKNSLKLLLSQMVDKGMMSEEEANTVLISKIVRFLDSDLAKRMRNSSCIVKEQHFVIGLSPSEVSGEWSNVTEEIIMVNGIIDCYFFEEDEIVLVDYKSDRVGEGGTAEIVKRYSTQLKLYTQAIEKNTGKKVKQALLYLFDNGEVAEITE